MLDGLGLAVIDELLGQARKDAGARFDLASQQGPTVRTDFAPIEIRHHRTPAEAVKLELRCVTLRHRQPLLFVHNLLITRPLCQRGGPVFKLLVSDPG